MHKTNLQVFIVTIDTKGLFIVLVSDIQRDVTGLHLEYLGNLVKQQKQNKSRTHDKELRFSREIDEFRKSCSSSHERKITSLQSIPLKRGLYCS